MAAGAGREEAILGIKMQRNTHVHTHTFAYIFKEEISTIQSKNLTKSKKGGTRINERIRSKTSLNVPCYLALN